MASDMFATQIRFEYALRDKLIEIAAAEKRTLNAQMVYFLEEGVRNYRPKKDYKPKLKKEDETK